MWTDSRAGESSSRLAAGSPIFYDAQRAGGTFQPMKDHSETLFKSQPKRIQKLNREGRKQIRERERKLWWRKYGSK